MADELTVARAQERVARRMGWKRTSDWPSAYPVTEFFNEVGESFVALGWNALTRPPVFLATVTGQAYSELPEDFAQHIWVGGSDISVYSLSLEDPTAVAKAQATTVGGGGHYVGCFTHGAPTVAGPKARARLDLGPIPTTGHAQAFVLVYKAGWVNVLDATSHIVLPAFLTPLYMLYAGAWMAGLEHEDGGSIEDRIDRLRASTLWQDAEERDESMQQDLGTLRGGVGQCVQSDDWPFPRYTGAVPIAP